MQFSKYGIDLLRLSVEQIEMLRLWRNDPKIASRMAFRGHITPEMQAVWFQRADTVENFYFIVRQSGRDIGLIDCKYIDWQTGQGDTGIFIYDDNFRQTPAPLFASLAMLDFMFGYFKLNRVTAKTLPHNREALDYNAHLGFEVADNAADCAGTPAIQLCLTAERYDKYARKLRAAAERVGGRSARLVFEPDRLPIDREIANLLVERGVNRFKTIRQQWEKSIQ